MRTQTLGDDVFALHLEEFEEMRSPRYFICICFVFFFGTPDEES
jgi:hypothetical protein